jgi:hypothetical protein
MQFSATTPEINETVHAVVAAAKHTRQLTDFYDRSNEQYPLFQKQLLWQSSDSFVIRMI